MDQESQERPGYARHRRRGATDRRPQEHERLWEVGPAWLSKAKGIGWSAEYPRYTRPVGAAQAGAAVWFALRQYRGT